MSRFSYGALKTIRVLGQKVEIYVSGSDGEFSARIGPDYFKSHSLKDLEAQLRKAAKRQRITVAIPATMLGGGLVQGSGYHRKYHHVDGCHVIITGLDPREHRSVTLKHETNGDVQSHEQWSIDRHGTLCRRMTAADIKHYRELKAAQRKVDSEFESFMKKWKIEDPVALVQAAISEKADTPDESEAIEDDGDPR